MSPKDDLERRITAQLTLLHALEHALHDRTGYWEMVITPDDSDVSHTYPVCMQIVEGPGLIFRAHDLSDFGPSMVSLRHDGEILLSNRADIVAGDLEMGYSLECAPL